MRLKTVIPQGLAHWIEREARTRSEADRLTKLSRYILSKYLIEKIPFEESIEISSTHFREQVSTHYLRDLKRLLSAGMVTSDNSYHFFVSRSLRTSGDRLGKCKSYQFTPRAINNEPEIVEYNERAKKQFSNEYVVKESVKLLSKLRLSLRSSQLKLYVRELITPQYIRERIKVGEEIPEGYYYTQWSKRPLPAERWQQIAQRNGQTFFVYKDKGHIGCLESFISERMYQTRTRYLESLVRLKDIRKRINITCSRNDTNNRLDTNLTNIKSELLRLVRLDGERLVSIDLSNSQFTILAHLINQSFNYLTYLDDKHFKDLPNIKDKFEAENTLYPMFRLLLDKEVGISGYQHYRDIISLLNVTHFLTGDEPNPLFLKAFRAFLNLTKTGIFYEELARLMSENEDREVTRSEAKKAMFLTAFSSHRYNPRPKQLLKAHYPELVKWMNEFKKASIRFYEEEGMSKKDARQKGNASLSVMLQQIESRVFIDNILTKLLRGGFRVFTKHDSILCKESDKEAVEAIVRHELNKLFGNGGYQLKIEYND
jgi:hypothetical protein